MDYGDRPRVECVTASIEEIIEFLTRVESEDKEIRWRSWNRPSEGPTIPLEDVFSIGIDDHGRLCCNNAAEECSSNIVGIKELCCFMSDIDVDSFEKMLFGD